MWSKIYCSSGKCCGFASGFLVAQKCKNPGDDWLLLEGEASLCIYIYIYRERERGMGVGGVPGNAGPYSIGYTIPHVKLGTPKKARPKRVKVLILVVILFDESWWWFGAKKPKCFFWFTNLQLNPNFQKILYTFLSKCTWLLREHELKWS